MARKTNPISLRLNINRSPDGLWWSSRYYDQVFMRDFSLRQLMKAHLRKSPLPIIRFGLAGSPHKQQCVLYLTKLQQNHWIPRNNPESKLMRWRQRQKQKLLREQRLLIQEGQRIHWKKVAKARSRKKGLEPLTLVLETRVLPIKLFSLIYIRICPERFELSTTKSVVWHSIH